MKDTNCNTVGTCPVCGQGDIVETADGFCCNAEKRADGTRCGFRIYRRMHGVEMDADLVRQLVTLGRTGEMEMRNANGQPFSARFVMADGKVDVRMKAHALRGRCPVCGGRVLRTSKGYACEFSLMRHPLCRFHVTGFIHGRKITEQEIEDFLNGTPQVLDGFTAADAEGGKSFSSLLTLREDGLVGLEPVITVCPSCGGNILVSPVAYNCSNYKTPGVCCRFFLWRNIAGHDVTADEMRQVCEEGRTREPLEFYKHNGTVFYQRLALSADRKRIVKV